MTTPQPPDESGPGGESFLARKTFGLAHYLWIALAVTLALGFVPRGVKKTLQSNTNKAEDWLPPSYAESADLVWFRDHFAGEAFVLVSWDGCTLGAPEKLLELEKRLLAERDPKGDWAWYPRVRSGPTTIDSLVDGPASLSQSAAISRIEGALVGPPKLDPDGRSLGDGSRVTCLLAYLDDRLTNNNLQMRAAVERVRDIVVKDLGVPADAVHLGGPPVDNITIDVEGERTLLRLAGVAGALGFALAYACLRSTALTLMVFWSAGASAGMSLALVYWFGRFEVLFSGALEPRLGKADAILMSMPAVVYVSALSGAIHIVNYYCDERAKRGRVGAAERAVTESIWPSFLAAFTTAVGLGSLATSDILPIEKFGLFTGIGVMIAFGMLYLMMPVFLHRFPPSDALVSARAATNVEHRSRRWYGPLSWFVTRYHYTTVGLCLALQAVIGWGVTQTETSVKLLGLLDPSCRLIEDYGWLERHLGHLVPMEVVVALDADRLRSPDEPAVDPAAKEPRYRMTMFERAGLAARLQAEVESLDEISRALSAATFAAEPPDSGGSSAMRRGFEYTTSQKLEQSREELREYLRKELVRGKETGRELWRVSARVTALGEVDYGQFTRALADKVQPVLDAYAFRDDVVRGLAAGEAPLEGARVCVLTESNDPANPRIPAAGTPEARLVELLREVPGLRLSVYALDTHLAADEATREKRAGQLAGYDSVVALREGLGERLGEDLPVRTLAPAAQPEVRPAATAAAATYTGIVPLVYKTQRELLRSLYESILWATVLIGGIMVLVLRSIWAGVAAMLPNVLPILIVFGALGWLEVPIDIGIMMTASVALGVAVDDTLHFVTWFARAVRRERIDRETGVLMAFDHCATSMMQTTVIGGLGLSVFAVSTFTPTQQFGVMMVTILGVALFADLVMLPALLAGPAGRPFAPGAPARPRPPEPLPSDAPADAPAESPGGAPAVLAFEPREPASARPDADGPLSPANAALRSKLRSLRRSPR